ncbi:MAG: hypothetical protein ACREEB_01785 [Caulobacteraceae bacterium]
MRTLFNSRPWGRRPPPPAEQPANAAVTRADVDAAYERGRRDAARRRRGSPFFSLLALIAIAALAMLLYLAAQTGSFSSGGAVVDNDISNASQRAQAPFKNAANNAGNALENAGQRLKRDAGSQPNTP